MKTFKINRKTNKTTETVVLAYDEMFTSGSGLCLVIDKEKALEVYPGCKLCFQKHASGNTGELLPVCNRDVIVTDVVDNEYGKRLIYFEYINITPLTVALFTNVSDSGEGQTSNNWFKFYFSSEHGMVPLSAKTDDSSYVFTDFDAYDEKKYTVYIKRGENIIYFSDIGLCYPGEFVRGKNIISEDGFCCQDDDILFNYETMERNSILASSSGVISGDTFVPEPGDVAIFCTNQYFYTKTDGQVKVFDNVTVSKYTDFMGLGVVLEQDYDAKRMYQEYQVNEQFVKKIKNSIIPDFVDLEKIKYAPAISSNNEVFLATGLTFNLHFRSRVMDKKEKYKFDPTWHLDELMNTWNNNGINSAQVKRKDIYKNQNFVNSSNLIGYLGFTDDDIYNQKNRVKQSFLRLSFYDSPNPLEQNLLYYSTIFLDTGDLYGKFVKRKMWLMENNANYNEVDNPVVWSQTGTTDPVPAVTSQIIVNDEYDMTRSGEGFNLYLFKQDAPIENDPKPIYMKVEFNHAGYGRTVPLIFWKKDENTGEPIPLTVANYFENLYIKMKYALTDKGYVYIVDEKIGEQPGIMWENDRIVFNLFEPMLELEGDEIPDIETVEVPVTATFTQDVSDNT